MRYKTITEEITESTFNLFIAMFINTALITIIMHAQFYDISPSIYISSVIPEVE